MINWVVSFSIIVNLGLFYLLCERNQEIEDRDTIMRETHGLTRKLIYSANHCRIILEHYYEIVAKRKVIECNRDGIMKAYKERSYEHTTN